MYLSYSTVSISHLSFMATKPDSNTYATSHLHPFICWRKPWAVSTTSRWHLSLSLSHDASDSSENIHEISPMWLPENSHKHSVALYICTLSIRTFLSLRNQRRSYRSIISILSQLSWLETHQNHISFSSFFSSRMKHLRWKKYGFYGQDHISFR